jgi:hypothetical protein
MSDETTSFVLNRNLFFPGPQLNGVKIENNFRYFF